MCIIMWNSKPILSTINKMTHLVLEEHDLIWTVPKPRNWNWIRASVRDSVNSCLYNSGIGTPGWRIAFAGSKWKCHVEFLLRADNNGDIKKQVEAEEEEEPRNYLKEFGLSIIPIDLEEWPKMAWYRRAFEVFKVHTCTCTCITNISNLILLIICKKIIAH